MAGQPLQEFPVSASSTLLITCPDRSAYRALKKLEFRSIVSLSGGGFYNHTLADLDPRFLRDVSALGPTSGTGPARIHSAGHSTGARIFRGVHQAYCRLNLTFSGPTAAHSFVQWATNGYTFRVAKTQPRIILRLEVTPDAIKSLQEMCERNGMKQVTAVGKIFACVFSQDREVQSNIVGHRFTQMTDQELTMAVLRRIARA
jgi:hypothetical protein